MTKIEIKREIKQALAENGIKMYMKDMVLFESSFTSMDALDSFEVKDSKTGEIYRGFYEYNFECDSFWTCYKVEETTDLEETDEIVEIEEVKEETENEQEFLIGDRLTENDLPKMIQYVSNYFQGKNNRYRIVKKETANGTRYSIRWWMTRKNYHNLAEGFDNSILLENSENVSTYEFSNSEQPKEILKKSESQKTTPTKEELKDLFKAVKNYCILINRLGYKLKDYYKKLDVKEDALYMIEDFYSNYAISKFMKNFLIKRVNQTTNNH